MQKEQQQEQEQEEQQQEESARSMLNAKRGAKISSTSQQCLATCGKSHAFVLMMELWNSILAIPWQPMASSPYLQVRV